MTIQVITANTTAQNATPTDNGGNPYSTGLEEVRIWSQTTQNQHNNNYSGDAYFKIYASISTDREFSLLQADLSNIPAGATIVSATVYAYCFTNGSFTTNATLNVEATALLRNWVLSQVTYNSWSTGNSWTTAGALSNGNDRDTSISGTGAFGTTNNSWMTFDVTDFVRAVVNGDITNNGVLLAAADLDANPYHWREFRDSTATDGERPEWVIDYTAPGGATPPFTSVTVAG